MQVALQFENQNVNTELLKELLRKKNLIDLSKLSIPIKRAYCKIISLQNQTMTLNEKIMYLKNKEQTQDLTHRYSTKK